MVSGACAGAAPVEVAVGGAWVPLAAVALAGAAAPCFFSLSASETEFDHADIFWMIDEIGETLVAIDKRKQKCFYTGCLLQRLLLRVLFFLSLSIEDKKVSSCRTTCEKKQENANGGKLVSYCAIATRKRMSRRWTQIVIGLRLFFLWRLGASRKSLTILSAPHWQFKDSERDESDTVKHGGMKIFMESVSIGSRMCLKPQG